MFRRRALDPSIDRTIDVVEQAKAALVGAVPSPRGVVGRSLAEAVLAFEDGLRRAETEMERWPRGSDHIRRICEGAIEESLRRAERLRLEAPALDVEGLITVLGDLIAPLDTFSEAERTFRA
jgi:hypothetical protein